MAIEKRPLLIGIGGLGTIGSAVMERLHAGIAGFQLCAVSAHNRDRARERLARLGNPLPVVSLEELADLSDIVIECAPSAVFARVAEPAVKAGRIFMPLSVGALLTHFDLVDWARECGSRIIVPTGGLLGLDAVRACAEGHLESVEIVTRKPPASLSDAPWVKRNGIDLDHLTTPLKVFEGSVREAATGFPANINVGAALSLAGIGPDRTRSEIWADPTVVRNTHRIKVEADAARFEMTIENVPTLENPRTSRLTALSVIATLRGLVSPLRVGT